MADIQCRSGVIGVPQATDRIRSLYARHRYGILFFSLLLSLFLIPGARVLGMRGSVVEFFLAANLVAAVVAVGPGRLRRVALVILSIALAVRLGGGWLDHDALSTGSLALWGVIALLAAASALVYALRGRDIGREQVFAALGAYLLAGFFFGLIFWVIEQVSPASLSIGGATPPDGISTWDAIYFSFVTLASLGYGDVLPVSDSARGLAVVEVVGGQLYLAVMVARLVSAWR